MRFQLATFLFGILIISSSRHECYGQDVPISIRVYNIEDNLSVPHSTLSNTRNTMVGITSGTGYAKVQALLGDTLVVNKLNYITDSLVITSYDAIEIGLRPRSILLDEVIVSARRPSPLEKLQDNHKLYKTIFLKGDNKNIVQVAPLVITVNINRLYSALSKEGKDARRLQGLLLWEYEEAIISERFTEQIITETTGLTHIELSEFMVRHRPSFEWITKASDYDLLMYIRHEFEHYMKTEKTRP